MGPRRHRPSTSRPGAHSCQGRGIPAPAFLGATATAELKKQVGSALIRSHAKQSAVLGSHPPQRHHLRRNWPRSPLIPTTPPRPAPVPNPISHQCPSATHKHPNPAEAAERLRPQKRSCPLLLSTGCPVASPRHTPKSRADLSPSWGISTHPAALHSLADCCLPGVTGRGHPAPHTPATAGGRRSAARKPQAAFSDALCFPQPFPTDTASLAKGPPNPQFHP